MSRHVLLVVPGLDPVRVLRTAVTLGPSELLLPITETADHWLDTLGGLLDACGMEVAIRWVVVDEWDFSAILSGLREAVAALGLQPDDLMSAVVGGGTKPIAAAVAVVADEAGARLWALDEGKRLLIGPLATVPLAEPAVNLPPGRLGRLYAVHHEITPGESVDDATLLHWLREQLSDRRPTQQGQVEEASRTFEEAVVALLRVVAPDDFDVWGPHEFVLRDPIDPEQAALDPGDSTGRFPYRRFEVDGVVVRGTRLWVVESKFIGSGLTQTRMRTAFAELHRRRIDLGGVTATGILVVLNDSQADATPEGPVDEFAPSGIEVLSTRDLKAALDAVDSDDPAALAASEVARIFAP